MPPAPHEGPWAMPRSIKKKHAWEEFIITRLVGNGADLFIAMHAVLQDVVVQIAQAPQSIRQDSMHT